MKYLIIVLMLMGSIHSENVGGFNFGGYFKDHKKHKEIIDASRKLTDHQYDIDSVKFFDEAVVGTNKKYVINMLGFTKDYTFTIYNLNVVKKKMANDFKLVLNTIQSRYGKFDVSGAKNILGPLGESNGFYIMEFSEKAYNPRPKSKKIGMIILVLESEESEESEEFMLGDAKNARLSLLYVDKKIFNNAKTKQDEKLEGF